MKFTTGSIMSLCLIGLNITGVFSVALEPNIAAGLDRNDPANRAALEAECGDLGVMTVPEGEDASKVRHCRDHPHGRSRWPDIEGNYPEGWDAYIASTSDENIIANNNNEVDDRRGPPPASSKANTPNQIFGRTAAVCIHGTYDYGCDHGGYCWRVCGGEGEFKPWCWLAWSGSSWGNGPWMRCRKMDDCNLKKGGECCTGSWACGCDCRNK